MKHTVEVVESCLKQWEDTAFIVDSLRSIDPRYVSALASQGMPDLLGNASGLRDHLMLAQTPSEAFDKMRFLGTERIPQMVDIQQMLPYVLWHWSSSSRRVFQLDADLHALLRHTVVQPESLASGIPLPFPSFLLLLSEPIRGSSLFFDKPVHDFSAILVFPVPAEDSHDAQAYLGIMLLADAWKAHRVLNAYDRERVRQAIPKARRRGELPPVIKETVSRVIAPYTEFCTFLPEAFIRHASASPDDFHPQSLLPEVARLIVGFSLYLSTLPPGGRHRSDWKPPPRPGRPDPRAITLTAEICDVSSIHRLTSEERERLFSESITTGRELSAHFRRGFFRRPPGKGDDPEAPKTIWVTPTLVRRDRLQPGELVGGAISIVK